MSESPQLGPRPSSPPPVVTLAAPPAAVEEPPEVRRFMTATDFLDRRAGQHDAGPATWGWRGGVRRLSGGLLKPRMGPAERQYVTDRAAIQKDFEEAYANESGVVGIGISLNDKNDDLAINVQVSQQAIVQKLPKTFDGLDVVGHFRDAAWFQARPITTEWRERRALVALRDKATAPWTSIDPTLGEAHTTLAQVSSLMWEWEPARAEFEKAIALSPAYATAYQWYAEHLAAVGRSEESIVMLERAASLDCYRIYR